MAGEIDILIDFLGKKNLKLTNQRREILEAFLDTEKHVTAEDLYNIVKKKDPDIGFATVFRTLKLLGEADIAKEVDFGDRRMRYEHKYGHKHHDHLICVECGKFIEVIDEKIEKLQNELCKRLHFEPVRHKMEIFGRCRECVKKGDK